MNRGLSRRTLLIAALAAASTRAFAQGSPSFSLPIDSDELSLISTARINGESVFVMIDNGAAYTMADAAFGGRIPSAMSPRVLAPTLPAIELGGLMRLQPRALIDLSSVSIGNERPVAALIGMDLFQAGTVDLDFVAKTLTLRSAGLSPPEGARAVDLRPDPGLKHAVELSIEGGPPFQAWLDLGSAHALLLKPALADKLGLNDARTPSTRLATGATSDGRRADFTHRTGSVRQLRFAGRDIPDVPFEVGDFASATADALLGLPVLRKFGLRFDLASDQLWASDTPRFAEPFVRDLIGLQAGPTRRGLTVIHAAKASPAAAAGFTAGETIATINGDPASLKGLRIQEPGRYVDFTLIDGAKRNLTTARFD